MAYQCDDERERKRGVIMVLKVKEGESDLNFVLVLTGEYKNGREGRNMLTRPCPESV